MPKIYATANSRADKALEDVFYVYNVRPVVREDKRGRFFEVEIPEYWEEYRRTMFAQACALATSGASKRR